MRASAFITAVILLTVSLTTAHAKISIPDAENIIKEFTYAYENEVIKDGKRYVVNKKWSDNTFDLSIKLNADNSLVLLITKGAIENKKMTKDAFRLILCHEFGHYFGGAPKKNNQHWASSEGQSDYYATSKCIKRMLPQDDNFIQRVKNATLLFGQMLAIMNNEDSKKISLEAKDSREVMSMDTTHPSAQCRVDTMIAGLNCPLSEKVEFSNTNPDVGACLESSIRPEIAAGARPRCWYRPKIVGKVCQSKVLIPGQKIPLVNIFLKKYKDDRTAELTGFVGVANPVNKIIQKIQRLNNNERFETLDQKIVIDRDFLYIDQNILKSYLDKSLLPIKPELLNLKSQGNSYILRVSCKNL